VRRVPLVPEGSVQADGSVRYAVDLAPDMCGKLDYRLRAYPNHPLLTHPFELGLMIWV
jgi:starch phosphorylase